MDVDVETTLHMKEGLGDTSYARNSSLQKKSVDLVKRMIINSATDVYVSEAPQSFAIADLGCSSGPNALHLVGDIIKSVQDICRNSSRPTPEFLIFLNDLPKNDFNALFRSSPEFINMVKSSSIKAEGCSPLSVCLNGVPGSFYGRLFPKNSLHFIYSCNALHWLSQVPLGLYNNEGKSINKEKLYISYTSPAEVAKAYFKQYQKDFNQFLKSRSAEMAHGGQMVLVMSGRETLDHNDKRTTFLWEALAQSFATMVSQGRITQEEVDSYNAPFYAPCAAEIEEEVEKEGSFIVDTIQAYEIDICTGDAKKDGRTASMAIRAVQESMISHHFGEEVVDHLFENYSKLLGQLMEKERTKAVNIIAILRKTN
ncbi:probable methyltransferase TCM_000336 [Typha latifolia]|uniref:probable methyltransferase TCM_000336 n=1 Tax=Typha latifolia TaxID=4733 RepID=UPI003C2F83CE